MDRLVLEVAKVSSSDARPNVSAFNARSSAVVPSHQHQSRKIGPGPNDLCNLPNHKGLHHTNAHCYQQGKARPKPASAATSSPSNAELAKRYSAIEAAHLAKRQPSAVSTPAPVAPAYAVSTDQFDAATMAEDFPDEGFSAHGYAVSDNKLSSFGSILADSAATRSMVSDIRFFVHLKHISPVTITGISDGQQSATQIGSIVVSGFSEIDHSPMDILIPNVLYVPTMKVNLLSLSQLCDTGASFSGSNESLTVAGMSGNSYFICKKTEDDTLWETKVI